jgi:hypothetical protein
MRVVDMPASSARQLSLLVAFAFGVVFVAVLLVFVFFAPNPTNQQFEVIRIVLALAAGGVAAMIPGFLDLHLKAGATLALRAGGALAVFVVYFYSPARWAEPQPSSSVVNQHTEGPGSPAISGNGNTVTTTVPTPGKTQ